jgi:hypothetical protein
MTDDLSTEEVCALLKLEPHATCGFVRITFISSQRIAPSVVALLAAASTGTGV